MKNYKEFFKNKKVTVVGLGLLGKRLGDILFLLEMGAIVTVTDLKKKGELKYSVNKIEKYVKEKNLESNISYTFGEHRFEDFENKDFILKGQGVPLDSVYIKHARGKNIPIEMDESLFMKLAHNLNLDVKIIGVTGTRGKSTTTMLIYEILKQVYMNNPSTSFGIKKLSVFLGGNIKGTAVLPLLKNIKNGDIVVFELSSWQLQGFGEDKISPHISVFTNFMPDHLNYYGSATLTTSQAIQRYFKDKSYIYKYQKESDYLVLGEKMLKDSAIAQIFDIKKIKAKKVIAKVSDVPKNWKVKLLGVHNKQNIMCAVEVARILKIKESVIKKVVESFTGAPGRLELVKEIKGVKIYNDTNATTPEATIAALEALSGVGHPKSSVSNTRQASKVILIMGGMDKGLDVKKLKKILAKKTKKIFLTPGSGSDKIEAEETEESKAFFYKMANLKEAVEKAYKESKNGDTILFSPAFASFNMFKNEYDRGEQFMKIVKKFK